MALSEAAQSLQPWPVIGVTASDTGDKTVTGAPAGRVAIGIEGLDGTVVVGSESGTTAGDYTFAASGTTEAALVYFIL